MSRKSHGNSMGSTVNQKGTKSKKISKGIKKSSNYKMHNKSQKARDQAIKDILDKATSNSVFVKELNTKGIMEERQADKLNSLAQKINKKKETNTELLKQLDIISKFTLE